MFYRPTTTKLGPGSRPTKVHDSQGPTQAHEIQRSKAAAGGFETRLEPQVCLFKFFFNSINKIKFPMHF